MEGSVRKWMTKKMNAPKTVNNPMPKPSPMATRPKNVVNGSKTVNRPVPKPMPMAAAKVNLNTIKAAKIQCDESKPTTRIQIVLIGGKKRETVKVNLTTTVADLYGHVKALSGSLRALGFFVNA